MGFSLSYPATGDITLFNCLNFRKVLWTHCIKSVKQHELEIHIHVLLIVNVSLEKHQKAVHQKPSLALVEVFAEGVEHGADESDSEAVVGVIQLE